MESSGDYGLYQKQDLSKGYSPTHIVPVKSPGGFLQQTMRRCRSKKAQYLTRVLNISSQSGGIKNNDLSRESPGCPQNAPNTFIPLTLFHRIQEYYMVLKRGNRKALHYKSQKRVVLRSLSFLLSPFGIKRFENVIMVTSIFCRLEDFRHVLKVW